jgi:hypothetical protein
MGPEHDGGREAKQNRYPAAVKRPAGRNAADLSASHLRSDRLVVGSHERLAGLEASSVALDVVAMSWEIQLRVCNAKSNAKAAVRNAAEDVSSSRPRSDRFGGWQVPKEWPRSGATAPALSIFGMTSRLCGGHFRPSGFRQSATWWKESGTSVEGPERFFRICSARRKDGGKKVNVHCEVNVRLRIQKRKRSTFFPPGGTFPEKTFLSFFGYSYFPFLVWHREVVR